MIDDGIKKGQTQVHLMESPNNNTDKAAMTSAFHLMHGAQADFANSQDTAPLERKREIESDTEDEEVKLNCATGARGTEESDMNSSNCGAPHDDEDDDSSDEEKDLDLSRGRGRDGVVTFVTEHLRSVLPIVRPMPTSVARVKNLSPHAEENSSSDEEEGEDGDDESSHAGARGVALAIGTPSYAGTPASMSEGLSDGDDEEEGDDETNGFQLDYKADQSGQEGIDLEDDDDDCDSEVSSIIASLARDGVTVENDGSGDLSGHLLGVAKDRDDFLALPKTKRVLSFNTLAALNREAGGIVDSPKRRKSGLYAEGTGPMPLLSDSFSLGPSAMAGSADAKSAEDAEGCRRLTSPVISSSDDDELDGQLRDELNERVVSSRSNSRENTPVPLLTPPGSPLTVTLDDGATTTVCEWPSNLAVDAAMTAVIYETRPMSPDSLQKDWEIRIGDMDVTPSAPSSTLTPLFRGINVSALQ